MHVVLAFVTPFGFRSAFIVSFWPWEVERVQICCSAPAPHMIPFVLCHNHRVLAANGFFERVGPDDGRSGFSYWYFFPTPSSEKSMLMMRAFSPKRRISSQDMM